MSDYDEGDAELRDAIKRAEELRAELVNLVKAIEEFDNVCAAEPPLGQDSALWAWNEVEDAIASAKKVL